MDLSLEKVDIKRKSCRADPTSMFIFLSFGYVPESETRF